MLGKMLLITAKVDRFPGIFLEDKLAVDEVADRPHAFPIEAIPLTLSSGSLLESSRSSNPLASNVPAHTIPSKESHHRMKWAKSPLSLPLHGCHPLVFLNTVVL